MKRKLGKKTLGVIGLLLLLGAAGGGYYVFTSKSGTATTVRLAQAEQGSIESVVTAQGTLEPKDYVDVGAQVSGQIKKLHVEIGDTVKSGDLIAEIDPDVYQSQVTGDEANLKTLQAQKAEQDATLKQARRNAERNRVLFKGKAISKETYEQAMTDMEVAQAKLESLAAQIEGAQSTLDGDRTKLNYTKIYAPMSGTVVDQSIKEGQTINASQSAPEIVQIANLDTMTVRGQVAEADVGRLKSDMNVYFTTLGSTRKWNGKIRQILPTPETVNDVVLYNVLVDVENTDHLLMTGMTAQLFFVIGRAENVVTLPLSALTKRLPDQDSEAGTAYQVEVMGERPETRTIWVGLSDRTRGEVRSGLKAGETINITAKNTEPTATTSTKKAADTLPPMPGRL